MLEPLPAHLADSLGTIRRSSRGRNSSRAARGADIDEHGRRGGGRDPDDTDDDDDKEYDLPVSGSAGRDSMGLSNLTLLGLVKISAILCYVAYCLDRQGS